MREELEKVGEGEHRVLVGDVGHGAFWGLLKMEVSCVPFLSGDSGICGFQRAKWMLDIRTDANRNMSMSLSMQLV